MKNQKFRKLKIWNKAMSFIEVLYRVTQKFPTRETYGLTSQLRRAAVSIALNIAEGSGSDSDVEFRRFLTIALRSAYEVMCGVEVASRLQYCVAQDSNDLLLKCNELSAMITGLRKSLLIT